MRPDRAKGLISRQRRGQRRRLRKFREPVRLDTSDVSHVVFVGMHDVVEDDPRRGLMRKHRRLMHEKLTLAAHRHVRPVALQLGRVAEEATEQDVVASTSAANRVDGGCDLRDNGASDANRVVVG